MIEWILGLTAIGGCAAIAVNHATENLKYGEKTINNANKLIKNLTVLSLVVGGIYIGQKFIK